MHMPKSVAKIAFLVALFCGTWARAQTLDGFWLSDGNNMFYDVKGGDVRAFELTSISCIPDWQVSGKTDPACDPGFTATSFC
jgi:hypothetical protein